jgi:hypothetical protein
MPEQCSQFQRMSVQVSGLFASIPQTRRSFFARVLRSSEFLGAARQLPRQRTTLVGSVTRDPGGCGTTRAAIPALNLGPALNWPQNRPPISKKRGLKLRTVLNRGARRPFSACSGVALEAPLVITPVCHSTTRCQYNPGGSASAKSGRYKKQIKLFLFRYFGRWPILHFSRRWQDATHHLDEGATVDVRGHSLRVLISGDHRF